ncbi:MAG: tyrosine-type recombinase/integrase, partial [Rhodospirillales bacterium]|nr:tyrosine-type recombinase/integrase [Rhodospirillales bacterium]
STDPQPFPIPLTDEAQQALSAGRRPSGPIIVYEKTGRPYTPDHFSHVFREVADAAGLIGLWYHDLRRTAVVHLARAGCSISEISSVTGHSPEHCHRILKRYMPRDAQTARNAIAKVKEYRRRVGTGV